MHERRCIWAEGGLQRRLCLQLLLELRRVLTLLRHRCLPRPCRLRQRRQRRLLARRAHLLHCTRGLLLWYRGGRGSQRGPPRLTLPCW